MEKETKGLIKVFMWILGGSALVVAVALLVDIHTGGLEKYLKNDGEVSPVKSSTDSQAENIYQNNFSLLSSAAKELSVQLDNTLIGADKPYTIKALSQSSKAAGELGKLFGLVPFSQLESSKTLSYLAKTEDYCTSLLYNLSAGKTLSKENKEALKSFAKTADTLNSEIKLLYKKINSEDHEFSFSLLGSDIYFSEGDNYASSMFGAVNSTFEGYPEINYDGAYSDSLKKVSYKGLEGLKMTGREDIEKSMTDYFMRGNDTTSSYKYDSEVKSGITGHSYTIDRGSDKLRASFSSSGGKLISLKSDTLPKSSKLSTKEAAGYAEKFLKGIGMENLSQRYHTTHSNTVTFEYMASQDDMSLYADTVKVQVSLEDGKILGYDATEYYTRHTKRAKASPGLSESSARKLLPADMQVSSSSMGYLPGAGGDEALSYEFVTKRNGKNYVVYMDAESGAFSKVSTLTDDDTGYFIN